MPVPSAVVTVLGTATKRSLRYLEVGPGRKLDHPFRPATLALEREPNTDSTLSSSSSVLMRRVC